MDPHDDRSNTAIDDVQRLVEICNPTTLGFDFNQAFWRGHGSAQWSLVPQVFRQPSYDPDRECSLMGHFQARAGTRSHTSIPDPNDYFGWLFLAQHYGLPTRLLDWSESPLVALYFAVTEDHKDQDGCLWALEPGGLNNQSGLSRNLVQIRSEGAVEIAHCAFVPASKCDPIILAIDGREIDLRMMVQMGRFTLHGADHPIEQLFNNGSWLRKYIIRKEVKHKIRTQLAALGIRQWALFPDLSNLTAELRLAHFG